VENDLLLLEILPGYHDRVTSLKVGQVGLDRLEAAWVGTLIIFDAAGGHDSDCDAAADDEAFTPAPPGARTRQTPPGSLFLASPRTPNASASVADAFL